MENIQIKLNIKTFATYERLTGKSFNSINYNDQEEILNLLYACFIANNTYKINRETFVELINKNKKISKQITDLFKQETDFIKQFNNQEEDSEPTGEKGNYFIKDIIPILVMNCNLDINYVLYDLEISAIGDYLNAYDLQSRSKLEMERLWCYLGILPHVDGKKIKSPKDLMTFNWEKQETKDNLKDWDLDKLNEILNTQTK